jgi:hypothetical protein
MSHNTFVYSLFTSSWDIECSNSLLSSFLYCFGTPILKIIIEAFHHFLNVFISYGLERNLLILAIHFEDIMVFWKIFRASLKNFFVCLDVRNWSVFFNLLWLAINIYSCLGKEFFLLAIKKVFFFLLLLLLLNHDIFIFLSNFSILFNPNLSEISV